jgi:hypothetical protein
MWAPMVSYRDISLISGATLQMLNILAGFWLFYNANDAKKEKRG